MEFKKILVDPAHYEKCIEEVIKKLKIPRERAVDAVSKTYVKKINHILGPISLVEHHLGDITIYIFGDQHERLKGCGTKKVFTHITDFIKETIRSNPHITIDLFLETKFVIKKRDDHPREDYLFDIGLGFKSCLDYNKSECEYNNLRAHYADIRKIGICYSLQNIIYFEALLEEGRLILPSGNMQYKLPPKEFTRLLSKQIVDLSNSLENYKGNAVDYFIEACDFKGKITKQIGNVVDEYIKHKFREYVDGVTSGIIKIGQSYRYPTKKKLVEHLRNEGIKLQKTGTIDSLMTSEARMGVLYYSSFVMDFYLVHRIFRKFRSVEGKYSERPKNIIVYVGDAHASLYSEFLTYIGFHKVQESYSEEQCLDIGKFRQPFFQ